MELKQGKNRRKKVKTCFRLDVLCEFMDYRLCHHQQSSLFIDLTNSILKAGWFFPTYLKATVESGCLHSQRPSHLQPELIHGQFVATGGKLYIFKRYIFSPELFPATYTIYLYSDQKLNWQGLFPSTREKSTIT